MYSSVLCERARCDVGACGFSATSIKPRLDRECGRCDGTWMAAAGGGRYLGARWRRLGRGASSLIDAGAEGSAADASREEEHWRPTLSIAQHLENKGKELRAPLSSARQRRPSLLRRCEGGGRACVYAAARARGALVWTLLGGANRLYSGL
jgi:hypothetical protein